MSDLFFQKVNDPYLKKDYDTTQRPHYLAVKDNTTNLLWLVPCSSQITKFENIIEKKKAQHKSTDTIQIVTIQSKRNALLFQDMFPILEKYIQEPYIRGNQPVYISDPKIILSLEKTANKVRNLIRRNIKFTPTQPDAIRIEQLMLFESLE